MRIDISEERGVRFLHFGTPWIQGAMRISRPWALELEYTRDLMVPLLLRGGEAWPASVLQVGLGAASVTKFLYRNLPQARLSVVEIDPDVVAAARLWFKLPPEDARLAIEIADGHEFAATTRRRFDLIVLDGYDGQGRAGMLDSVPFLVNARARLGNQGLLSVNLLTRTRGVKASVDRLKEAFDGRVLVLPPSEAGNTVAIAAVGPPIDEGYPDLRAAAEALRARTGLDLRPAVARLAAEHPGRRVLL